MAAGLALCAAFTSCEMKEELIGGKNSSDIGFLDLGVAVNASQNVITKADEVTDDGEQTGSSVSAADFPVLIKGVTDPTYEKSFTHFSEIESPIELPVGTYAVSAHSDLELQTQMSVPYYEGTTKNNLVITKDVESKADVICKMKNTRIQLNYTDQFTANFTEWTILFDDGKNNTLTFKGSTSNASNPAPVYWLISENVSNITIHVEATNLNGDKVTDSRVLTKPAGSGDSDYWTGGDALNVEMNGVKPDPENPTGVTGIEIKVDVTFDEEEESVEVPVTPGTGGGDEPTPDPDPDPDPSDDAPTLSGQYLDEPLVFSASTGGEFPTVEITMNVPKGIASVWVKVDSDNTKFETATDYFGLCAEPDGANLVGNSNLGGMFALPTVNATEYKFSLGAELANMLVDFTGTHNFIVKVVDSTGAKASDTLTITITE